MVVHDEPAREARRDRGTLVLAVRALPVRGEPLLLGEPFGSGGPWSPRRRAGNRPGRRRAAHRLPPGPVRRGAAGPAAPPARGLARPRRRRGRQALPDRRHARPPVADRVAHSGTRPWTKRRPSTASCSPTPTSATTRASCTLAGSAGRVRRAGLRHAADGRVPARERALEPARRARQHRPPDDRAGAGDRPHRQLRVTAVAVPHRDELSDTVGFRVRGAVRVAPLHPRHRQVGARARPLDRRGGSVDVALLDGTFDDAAELPGRSMAEIPHPLVGETWPSCRRTPEGARPLHPPEPHEPAALGRGRPAAPPRPGLRQSPATARRSLYKDGQRLPSRPPAAPSPVGCAARPGAARRVAAGRRAAGASVPQSPPGAPGRSRRPQASGAPYLPGAPRGAGPGAARRERARRVLPERDVGPPGGPPRRRSPLPLPPSTRPPWPS